MTTKTVPFHYSILWLQTGMKITERYYGLFLGCVLSMFMLNVGFGFIPFIGTYLSSVISFVASVGMFRTTQKIFKNEVVSFDSFLSDTFDTRILKELLPMLAVSLACLAFSDIVHMMPVPSMLKKLVTFLTVILQSLSVYAAYCKLNSSLSWEECFLTVFEGTWKNVACAFAFICVVGLFLMGCALLLVVPLFFYGLPVLFPVNYLVYQSIFGDMDLDAVYKAWSQKPAVPAPIIEAPAPTSENPPV